jgi:hypothetical protein
MKHIKLYEEFIAEATDYAVMLTGGSVGDKSRPRDAKGYVGMDVDKAEWLMSLDNAKEKAKRMNANLSPGEKKHYGLKYVIVPAKAGKFIKESEDTLDEATLEIKGHAYNMWNDKQVQKELKDINVEIIGQINGVMTISGDKSEIDKVKAIFGLKESEDILEEGNETGWENFSDDQLKAKFVDYEKRKHDLGAQASKDFIDVQKEMSKRSLEQK